jgi:hypothetical protein
LEATSFRTCEIGLKQIDYLNVPDLTLTKYMARKDKPLSPEKVEEFFQRHIPHRLCLLLAFRERQKWFYEEMRAGRLSGDLLRCAKDSALISIRLFANFLGLRLKKSKEKYDLIDTSDPKFFDSPKDDDLFVDRLGGSFAKLENLSSTDQELLKGLLQRADKELAHLTSNFAVHDTHNTAKVICDGITLIERLLREHLFAGVKRPFPSLRREWQIDENKWNFAWSDLGKDADFGRASTSK